MPLWAELGGKGMRLERGEEEIPNYEVHVDEEEQYEEFEVSTDPMYLHCAAGLVMTTPPRPILPGLMVRSSVGFVIGEPHVGKTLFMLDLALALATGTEWMGVVPVRRQRVISFWMDGRLWSIQYMLAALCAGREVDLASLDEWLMYRSKIHGFKLDLANTKCLGLIEQSARFHNADVILIDAWSNCFSGDENSRVEVERTIDALGEMAERAGVTILISDHTPVAGRAQKSVYQARGSSVKEAAPDLAWYLRTRRDGGREMRILKARGMTSAGETLVYRHEKVEHEKVENAVRIELVERIEAGGVVGRQEALEMWTVEWMADKEEVTPVEIAEAASEEGKFAGKKMEMVVQTVRNTLTRLKKAGLVEIVKRGVWRAKGAESDDIEGGRVATAKVGVRAGD